MCTENHIGERPGVRVGDGSHKLVSVLSGFPARSQFSGKIPHKCLIRRGVHMNLLLSEADS